MKARSSVSNNVLRVAGQMRSLHGELRSLFKSSNLTDLVHQLARVLTRVYPRATIDVLQRPNVAEPWHPLGRDDTENRLIPPIPDRHTPPICALDKTSRRLYAVHELADGSETAVVLTQRSRAGKFVDTDTGTLQIFMELFDNAYQSMLHRRKEKDLVFALNHRVLQLNSLIDTGIEVSKLNQRTSLQQLALERAASLTNSSKGLVTVSQSNGAREEIFFPHGEKTRTVKDPRHRIASRFRFEGATYTFKLFEKESRRGILAFEATDQLLLDALVRQVHASLENQYLHRQELEKQKIERDISVAASIQQRILPRTLPAIDGYEIAGINIPTRFVGGDYFDCITLQDGRYALVMADVAGKGVPAALLVSSLHAYLAAYLESPMSLAELAGRLNKVICRTSTPEKFITAFLGLLTPATGQLETVSAGHNPVYWLKGDGEIQELSAGGAPLGMLDLDLPYEREQIVLGRNDRLLLYTDGIPEATSEQNELFETVMPLQEFLKSHTADHADGFIKALIEDIRKFTGDAPQSDDITALYLIRL